MLSYSHPATRQDLWVLDRTTQKRDGFYIEVGAHDGVHHSNTKMLEDQLDWTGILIEPQFHLFEQLQQNRPNNRCCDYVIGPDAGVEESFLVGNSYGGLESYMPADWLAEHRRRGTPMVTRSTTHLEYLINHAKTPDVIDYLSLDTEGSEFAILKSIRWWILNPRINIITVEFRYDTVLLAKLEELLAPLYNLEHIEAFDAFFVRKDYR